jgi:hypothetical protein
MSEAQGTKTPVAVASVVHRDHRRPVGVDRCAVLRAHSNERRGRHEPFPPQQREYFESFPWWAVAFWAIGVLGGAIGCLLLLLENRLAFHVLLVSLIGSIVSTLGGLFLLGGMEVMGETNAWGVTVFPFLAAFAVLRSAMSKKGAQLERIVVLVLAGVESHRFPPVNG